MSVSGDTEAAGLGSLRLEELYLARDRRHELRKKIETLMDIAKSDLKALGGIRYQGPAVSVWIHDQDALWEVIEDRARSLKLFFEGYIMLEKCRDRIVPMPLDQAARCVEAVYRYAAFELTDGPDAVASLVPIWRGLLELA